MKTRITKPLHQFQQVKADNLNDNLVNIVEEYNGGLDGQNMPVEGVTVEHLKSADVIVSNANSTFSTMNGVVQDYNQVSNWNVVEGGLDVWTPRGSVDLDTADWSRGWNQLRTVTNFEDTSLSFDASEGMITGCAVIDFHHGVDRIKAIVESGPAFSVFRGHDWWSEWGVFVNNVLVAQTGKIYPRRITTQLPFKVAVGTQNVTIDLKWKTNNGWEDTIPWVDDPVTAFDVFGVTIWAREVKR